MAKNKDDLQNEDDLNDEGDLKNDADLENKGRGRGANIQSWLAYAVPAVRSILPKKWRECVRSWPQYCSNTSGSCRHLVLQHISPPPAGVTDILADKLWVGAGALHLHAE